MWELGTERMGLEAVIRLNEKSIRVSLRMEGSSQALVASALQTYTLRPVQSIDGVVPEDMDSLSIFLWLLRSSIFVVSFLDWTPSWDTSDISISLVLGLAEHPLMSSPGSLQYCQNTMLVLYK